MAAFGGHSDDDITDQTDHRTQITSERTAAFRPYGGTRNVRDEAYAERITEFPALNDYTTVRSDGPLTLSARCRATADGRDEVVVRNATFTDRDIAVPIDREYIGIDHPRYGPDDAYTAIVELGFDDGNALLGDDLFVDGGAVSGIAIHDDADEAVPYVRDVRRLEADLIDPLPDLAAAAVDANVLGGDR